MSLNRSEQMTLDYVLSHADERHYWQDKVRSIEKASSDIHAAAVALDIELWYYFSERSSVVEPFKSAAERDGLRRISMRSLAEYWIRLWTPPRTKKKQEDRSDSL
jgi:hypothetical protein